MNKLLKKAAALVLGAVMAVTVIPALPVQAADAAPLHTVVTTTGKGDDLKITYKLNLDKTVLSDGRVAIYYDENVLKLTKDSEANLFSEKDVNKKFVSGENKGIAIAFLNDAPKKTGGTVATLTFGVKAGLAEQETVISTQVFGLNNEENAVLADTLLTDSVKVGKPALEKPQMKSLNQTLIGVNVTWKKLSGAEGYEVYRATSANGSYSKIATVRDQDYWDVLIANKKTYYYKVRAYQGSGKNRVYSEFSDVKSIKVQKFKLF